MKKKGDKYPWIIGNAPPPIQHHSVVKHRIIQEYIDTYIRVVTANPRMDCLTLSIIDGFAGGGEYTDENGAYHHGSPVIAMDAVQKAEIAINAVRNKPCKIDARYYLVEKAASNFEYLKRHLSVHRPRQLPSTQAIKGDFVKASEAIISDIKRRKGGERALFILDQYGYDAVPMATLRRIFDQVGKAEVLLTFNVDSLITYLSDIPLFRQMLEKNGIRAICRLVPFVRRSQSSQPKLESNNPENARTRHHRTERRPIRNYFFHSP